jgi:multiple sugar transport system substrate-binding protein
MAGGEATRREFVLAAAGAAAALLTGCGGGGGRPAAPARFGSGTSYDGPPVTLDFWTGFTGGDGPPMLELLDGFMKEHPNIHVRMVTARWTDFYQKFPAAVSAGKGPDVAINHIDQVATNAAHGAIVPLDDLVSELGLEEADFAPDVWRAGVYRGHRYSVPLDMHPLGLYSNLQVLEKAGLDPKQPPRTREEYEHALEQLKGKGIQGGWISPFLFTGGFMFQSLLYQYGGALTDREATRATWNSDAGVQALTWMKQQVKQGYSPSNVGQDADAIAFKNGQNAFIWNGAWGIGDYGATEGLKWSLSPLPRIGDHDAAWSNSHNFVVPWQSKPDANKLQATKILIDAITKSPKWALAGQIPARRSARESPEFKKLKAQSALAEEVPFLRFAPPAPGLSDVRESTLDIAVAQAMNGSATIRDALDSSVKRANELLKLNQEAYKA